MRWFRRQQPVPGPVGAAPDPAAPPEPEEHPSLALPELFRQLHPDRRLSVLDLGPAVGSNVAFWSQRFLCTVEVADLYPSLAESRTEDPEVAVDAALPPPAPGAPPVDVVLAWNLFDYLERGRLHALAARLAARCRPGALLFAMVGTRPEIPRDPGSFVIRDLDRLTYRRDPTRTRPGRRYRPADIAQSTPGFATDRNFLLRHGVQEYLLVRQEEPEEGAAPSEDAGERGARRR